MNPQKSMKRKNRKAVKHSQKKEERDKGENEEQENVVAASVFKGKGYLLYTWKIFARLLDL